MHGGCTHSRNLKLSAGNRYTTWKIMAPHFLTRASRRRTFGEALEPENAMLSRTAIFYPVYPRSVCLFSFGTSGTHWAIADEQFQRSAFPRLDFSTCSRDEFVRLRSQAYGTSLKDRKTLEDEHMLEAVASIRLDTLQLLSIVTSDVLNQRSEWSCHRNTGPLSSLECFDIYTLTLGGSGWV